MPDPTQAQTAVTTPMGIHEDHTQNIAQNLNQAGHNISATDVKPAIDQPVMVSPILSLAADLINTEELEAGIKDLGYVVEADLKQGDKIRVTESKNPLKVLLERLKRKKNESEEIIEK